MKENSQRALIVPLRGDQGPGSDGDPATGRDCALFGTAATSPDQSREWWSDAAATWLDGLRGTGEASDWISLGRDDQPNVFAVRGAARRDRPVAETFRRAAGIGIRAARQRGMDEAVFVMPPGLGDQQWQAAAEGLELGDWRMDRFFSEDQRGHAPPRRSLRESGSAGGTPPGRRQAVRRGRILARAQNAARELVALPGNELTPAALAEFARREADETGFAVEVWEEGRLREEGFGAILAVAAGSEQPPRLIVAEHSGRGGDPVVLVGKGVTFDTGGISLKPPAKMGDMKYDMAGAAAALCCIRAAAQLDIPQRLIAVVPAVENMPSGRAVKPGDVVVGLSGKSMEVDNTDAEGRLILSDALTFARELSPAAILDFATLTGACVVALGKHCAAVMTRHPEIADDLGRAGTQTGERTWPLPLWTDYRGQIDSEIADVKNTGGRAAGTITAGLFLAEFVGDDVPWAHLDIAGVAWSEKAGGWQPAGPAGYGVRLAHEWLRIRG